MTVASVVATAPLLAQGGSFTDSTGTLPIKPSRTISFTTDEGSFMNVDVSPDGQTLVFDLVGDLFTLPATGGTATQITRGLGVNGRPVWSPDGQKIAYLSDISGSNHANVIDRHGQSHEVLGAADPEAYGDPAWTPDGHYVMIGGTAYGLAGGKVALNRSGYFPFQWSSDGRSAYAVDSNRIYRYDRTTNARTPISPTLNPSEAWGGVLSPDEQWWCFVVDSSIGDTRTRSLVALDLAHNTRRTLVASLVLKDHRALGERLHFAFSRDSKNLFIAYGGKIHRIDVATGADEVIPFTANVKVDFGSYTYHTFRLKQNALTVEYTRSANASPDGRHLVFSALDRVYVMDLPDGRPKVLAEQSVSQFQPTYSPDGQWIAYVSWCDTTGGQLWRVPAAGGVPQQLTHISGQYQRPTWSPDGKQVAVVRAVPKLLDRDDHGMGRLELVPVDSGAVQVIDDSVPLWNSLAFSADGHRIIYLPKRGRYPHAGDSTLSTQMVSKAVDGTDLRVVAIGANLTEGQQQVLSPDGRFLVVSADEDLYLVPLTLVTQPLVISDDSHSLSAIRFAQGVDPVWEQGGRVLAWTYGNKFYRVNPDKIVQTAEQATLKSVRPADEFVTASVAPDEIIAIHLTVAGADHHGTIALRDVRILSMVGEEVIEHGTVVVRDGRIIGSGELGQVSIPDDAKVMDLAGATVMPGLIDLHLHMRVPPDVFPQQSWMYLANLAFGVTSARDPSSNFDSFGYAELLRTGQMLGPRLFSVGRAVRYGDGVMRFDSPADAAAVVEKRATFGATTIKQYVLPTRLQHQWLLEATDEAGLNMTNEGISWLAELGMMKDGSTGVEHYRFEGDVYNDVITVFAASGTYFTPTLQVVAEPEAKGYFDYKYWRAPNDKLARFIYSDPKGGPTTNGPESVEVITQFVSHDTTEDCFLYASTIAAEIRKAGGRVTMGSHGNDEGVGPHNEIWALQAGGLTNLQALEAATIMAAEGLGIQRDLGSIEVGKIADLIVLNKNPLDDIHNTREIRYVMKDGILFDGDSLSEVWPVVRPAPEWKLHSPYQ